MQQKLLGVSFLAVVTASAWIVSAKTQDWAIFGLYGRGVFLTNVVLTLLAGLAAYVLAGGERWRHRASNAALAVAAVTLLVVLVEAPAAMKWVDYRVWLVPKMIGGPGPHNRQPEAGVGFRRPAHDEFTDERPGDAVVTLGVRTDRRYRSYHKYDRWGYRNRRDLTSAPVVLLGDSFVEGYKVTQDSIVSEALGRMLAVDVANLGQANYAPSHELAALKSRGLDLSARVVVWFLFEGDDFIESSDSYTLAEGWDLARSRVPGFWERSFARTALTWAIPASLRLYAAGRDPIRRAGILDYEGGREELMFFGLEPQKILRERAFGDVARILTEGYRIGQDWGSQLLVVLVPLKYRVYRDLVQPASTSQVGDWVANDIPQRLISLCAQAGIPFLDLTGALVRSASQDTLVYFLDDAHWTPAGHHVAAREIAAVVAKEGWLASQAR